MFKTVYSKMLCGILGLTTALLAALGFAVSTVFRSIYIEETQQGLLREADDINDIVVSKYIDDAKRPAAREELFVIARRYDAYIQLYFNDEQLGQRNFLNEETGSRWVNAEGTDLSAYANGVRQGKYDEIRYGLLSDDTGFETLTVMRPIINEESESIGVLFFHYDMTEVNASIHRVLFNVVFISLIGLVVAVPLVMLLSRGMTRPISHMREVVNRFTHGEFEKRVNIKGDDELAQLGNSFNAMADELNTLEAARRSFVANVSHELRSPLTSMRGFLEAMEDGTIPNEERDAYIGIVLDENRRMTLMVNDLLDLARIESGQYKLNMEAFDINELIRRVIITFEARIAAKTMDVEVDLPKGQLYVEADNARISQVLHNLVDNAVKYAPEGGRLRLLCSADKHIVTVSVEDNGEGITKEDLPHVFDRFYKAEKAHTPDGISGTGLGLSIAKLIIDQHSQIISAESDSRGTIFRFTLKRVAKPVRKDNQNGERTRQHN